MNLSQLAFEYRKLVFLIVGLLLINGVIAYFTLPAKEDPSITIREATVTTRYPGMSPDRIEQLITKTLEEEIRTIVAEGHIDGLLDSDTREMIEGVIELDDANVADIMTPTVYSVDEEALVSEIASLMLDQHLHRVLVTRGEKVVGIVTTSDLLGLLVEER